MCTLEWRLSVFEFSGSRVIWDGTLVLVYPVLVSDRRPPGLWRYYFSPTWRESSPTDSLAFFWTIELTYSLFVGTEFRSVCLRYCSSYDVTLCVRWDGWQHSSETQTCKHGHVRRNAGGWLGARVFGRTMWPGRGQRILWGRWKDSVYSQTAIVILFKLKIQHEHKMFDLLLWSQNIFIVFLDGILDGIYR